MTQITRSRLLASLSFGASGHRPSATSDQRVDGEAASPGEYESHARGAEQELQLVVREPLAELHQENRAEHVACEGDRERTRQEAEYEGNGSKDLEQRDQRSHDSGKRHSHVGERACNAGEAEDEELLVTVAEEYRARSDAKRRQPETHTARRRRAKEIHRLVPVYVCACCSRF